VSFYVYLHRKKTNGEVFYVGKGKDKRAWSPFGRNELWKRTAEKYGWYVEIVEKDLQSWYAFELEQDLIALYGRRDLGYGTLTNMSDGGDGPTNFGPEVRKKISDAIAGLRCYKADHNVYKFYNCDTKEIFEGKRIQFEEKYGITIGRLFTSKVKGINASHFGWMRVDHFPEGFDLSLLSRSDVIGENNPNVDEQVYTFLNVHTMEKFVGTRLQLKRNYKVNTNVLFFTGNYKGWIVYENQTDEDIDKIRAPRKYQRLSRRDNNVYEMEHKDGRSFKGTRHEFKNLFGFDPYHLLAKSSNQKVQKGWFLVDNRPTTESKRCKKIYKFFHEVHGERLCTRSVLEKEFSLDVRPLFMSKPNSHVKGWSLAPQN